GKVEIYLAAAQRAMWQNYGDNHGKRYDSGDIMANSGPADEEMPGGAGSADQAAVSTLVDAAAKGDQAAGGRLVQRFTGLVWSVTRSLGLSGDDAKDVFEATWLRLLERIDRIDDPDRLGTWLADTARREAALRSR